MVPRYAQRKLSFPPHPCPRTPDTQSATNATRGGGAPTASMRARHRLQASGASGRAAQHPQRLRGPLPTTWKLFATSIVSGARRDPKAQNDLDASAACGNGRAASRSLGPDDRPGLSVKRTRTDRPHRPHLRRASVRSSVARRWGKAAAAGRGAVLVSGWRSAVTWRRLGDLVGESGGASKR